MQSATSTAHTVPGLPCDAGVGLDIFGRVIGVDYTRSMHLMQPFRLLRQTRAQLPAVGAHRGLVVAGAQSEIEARIARRR